MNYNKELNQFKRYLENRVSSGTLRIYIYALRNWFSGLNGTNPTRETAQQYIDKLSKIRSASTVGIHAHSIMRYFRWKGNRIDLDIPTIRPPEPDYLTMDQIEELLLACNTVLAKTLVTVLFDTAVRISELLNIELTDIDWDYKIISVVRKGGRKEQVNISDKGLAALREWLDARNSRSKKVFMDLSYWDAWNIITALGKKTGIPVHPHTLRHSRAIMMLKKGVQPYIVQQHLGHASLATTMNIYGKFRAADIKEDIPAW